jgi:hypothetical protein
VAAYLPGSAEKPPVELIELGEVPIAEEIEMPYFCIMTIEETSKGTLKMSLKG